MFRLLEIFLSLFALIILSPLLICISLILRFTGECEVFYKQIRAGYKSERFKIYKFVTGVRFLLLIWLFFTPILIYTLHFHKNVILSHNNEN